MACVVDGRADGKTLDGEVYKVTQSMTLLAGTSHIRMRHCPHQHFDGNECAVALIYKQTMQRKRKQHFSDMRAGQTGKLLVCMKQSTRRAIVIFRNGST